MEKDLSKVPPINLWSYPYFLNYVLTMGNTSLYSCKKNNKKVTQDTDLKHTKIP